MHLLNSIFQSVIKNTPLISIDLIVENTVGDVLLGLRTNRPALGKWFVPGGRILKVVSQDQETYHLRLSFRGLNGFK